MVWHIVFGTAEVSRKELKISALNKLLLENLLVAYFANFPLPLCSVTVRRVLFKISISRLLYSSYQKREELIWCINM